MWDLIVLVPDHCFSSRKVTKAVILCKNMAKKKKKNTTVYPFTLKLFNSLTTSDENS